ncbi:MAG: hypothetical protein KJ740_11630, partial [Gammaproteobacteria bacterium]|nr:hypothetical protein [Gammaproteobacteria bacterium]
MAIGRAVRDTETDPFYDMLFNMLIAFVFLFVIAILSFNPKARKAGDIPAKAEFMEGDIRVLDTCRRAV